jgi:hypothetical protein
MARHSWVDGPWSGDSMDARYQRNTGELHAMGCVPKHLAVPNNSTFQKEAREQGYTFWPGDKPLFDARIMRHASR